MAKATVHAARDAEQVPKVPVGVAALRSWGTAREALRQNRCAATVPAFRQSLLGPATQASGQPST